MKLSNLENWIQGKNPSLCLFAIEIVSGIEHIYSVCQAANQINLNERVKDRAFVQRWNSFYIHSAGFYGCAWRLMLEKISPKNAEFIDSVIDAEKCKDVLLNDWIKETQGMSNIEIFDYCKEQTATMDFQLKEYIQELRNKQPKEIAFVPKTHEEDEILLFFFKVWLPCWLEYGNYLPSIMTKAVNGDYQALENLLRIDHWILEHDDIRYQWQKKMVENPLLSEDWHRAIKNKPLQNITMTHLKYLFGALIYQVFNRIDEAVQKVNAQFNLPKPKSRISAEKIYQLFTAYSQDVLGEASDPDLDSPGTFRTGVSRNKDFWNGLFE
jgi:hypothetical protein